MRSNAIIVINTHSQSGSHIQGANSTDSGFALHNVSALNLVQQCINQQASGGPSGDIGSSGTSVKSRFNYGMVRAHPNAFKLPGMAAQRRALSHGAHKFRSEFEKQMHFQVF